MIGIRAVCGGGRLAGGYSGGGGVVGWVGYTEEGESIGIMFPPCADKCRGAIEDRFEAFLGGGVCEAAVEGLPYVVPEDKWVVEGLPYVVPEDMWVVEGAEELGSGYLRGAALTKAEARCKAAQEMRGAPGERHCVCGAGPVKG